MAKTARVLFAVAVIGVSPAYAARWYESYDRALKALEAQDWQSAQRQLEEALAERDESGLGVRTYGVNFIDYLPYLKLGVAHYHLGNYDAALTAFEREELLGAVARSDNDKLELRKFRDLARQARETAAGEERNRIVADSLARVKNLETEGRLDEAIAEAGKALAADPNSSAAKTALGRLQVQARLQEQQQESEERFAALVGEGKRLLTAGQYADAAARLRQAVDLRPDPEARSLLTQSQRQLERQLTAERSASQRSQLIAEGLRDAEQSGEIGDYPNALGKLQSVLALDSTNRQALDLQARFLVSQNEVEQLQARRETVRELLRQVHESMEAGLHEAAMSMVFRVLRLEPDNAEALQALGDIQSRFGDALVGTIGGATLQPLVLFLTDRREEGDGESADDRVERSTDPVFQLMAALLVNAVAPEVSAWVTHRGQRADLPLRMVSTTLLASGQYRHDILLDHDLDVGRSVFQVAVADDSGRADSAEYTVVYRLPLHRNPWTYAALAAVTLVGAGIAYARSLAARRRKLRRRFNPYVAGAPVTSEELFFGRERLLDRVLQTIHNNSILLYGERRIGKTSFQHCLKKRLQQLQDPDFDFYPVYVDLQGTPETKFFATLAEDIFDQLRPYLDDLRPNPKLHEESSYGYREFVRDVRKVLRTLKKRGPKRVKLVLQIDEVDELNSYNPRVNQRLRSLFMKSFAEDLIAVVSGVGIKKHWESEGSPWYNFFEEIRVQPFRDEDATQLIERPIRGVFTLEDGATRRIIELTDCKPYLIQKVCVALVNRLHDEGRRVITVADVDAVGRPEEA